MERIPTKGFDDLLVWKKAHAFVLETYRITKTFPKEETYGLTSQFRNSSRSIAANISEGYKKKGRADKARFMNISQGSLEESRYYIILSRDLGYITEEKFQALMNQIIDVSQLLQSYYTSLLQPVGR